MAVVIERKNKKGEPGGGWGRHLLYHGPRAEVLDFFASLGLDCPVRKDPSTFLQEITTPQGAAPLPIPPPPNSLIPRNHLLPLADAPVSPSTDTCPHAPVFATVSSTLRHVSTYFVRAWLLVNVCMVWLS